MSFRKVIFALLIYLLVLAILIACALAQYI